MYQRPFSLSRLFVLACFALPTAVFGQNFPALEEIRIGADVKPWAQTAIQKGYTGTELYAEASWGNKFFTGIALGFADANRADSIYTYQNHGQYFRLQAEKNIMYGTFAEDAIGLGLGYGFSSFSHSGSLKTSSPYWGDYMLEIPKEKLSAHWLEGVVSLKVKATKRLNLQAVLRLRVLLSQTDRSPMSIAEIPGIGDVRARGSLNAGYRVLYTFGKKAN